MEFWEELVLSQANKELTKNAYDEIYKLVQYHASRRFDDPIHQKAVILETMTDIIENERWMKYNPKFMPKPYLSQIILCYFAKYRMNIYRQRQANK